MYGGWGDKHRQSQAKSHLTCWKCRPEPLFCCQCHREGCSGGGQKCSKALLASSPFIQPVWQMFSFLSPPALGQAGAQALQHHCKPLLHSYLYALISWMGIFFFFCHWISLKADAKLIIETTASENKSIKSAEKHCPLELASPLLNCCVLLYKFLFTLFHCPSSYLGCLSSQTTAQSPSHHLCPELTLENGFVV